MSHTEPPPPTISLMPCTRAAGHLTVSVKSSVARLQATPYSPWPLLYTCPSNARKIDFASDIAPANPPRQKCAFRGESARVYNRHLHFRFLTWFRRLLGDHGGQLLLVLDRNYLDCYREPTNSAVGLEYVTGRYRVFGGTERRNV